VREYRSDVPASVDMLLTRALAMRRDERFQTAHELASAIEEARLEISTGRSAARRRLGTKRMRRPFIWAGAVALALAVSALAAPPIRTAVAKNRAAANARAAALAEMKTVQEMELGRQVGTDGFALAAASLGKQIANLHGRDSLFAEGLIALGRGAFQNACASFDRMRAADSLDALAWYGLGDCQGLDSAVVRDAKSPSGLRFRTSWAAAANAYVRAATLSPATNRALRYGMLSGLLPITPAQIRVGRAADGTRQFFGAHPSADGDSVAFVPYPIAEIIAGEREVLSPSLPEALRRNRDTLVAAARRWTASFPDNPESFEALAAGLEARGELGSDEDGADGALRRARSLARTPDDRLRLGASLVRVRIKRGELEAALDLADSLLAAVGANPSREQAGRLVGLAALTGRVEREAQLRSLTFSAANAARGIAPPLTSLSSRLFARAAAGVCDDSLLVLRRQLDTLLESYSQPIRRAQFRRELMTRPMSLAYPCFGMRSFEGLPAALPLDAAERAAANGDRRRAAAILDSVESVRQVLLPGEVSLDYVLEEAKVRAAIGDTVGATGRLDRVLRALPTLSQYAVREEAQSAAIGRAFLFRAELARASRDTAEQQLRARQALMIWRHADASLAPTVERLRSLASPLR
jgi:hypothetical protein